MDDRGEGGIEKRGVTDEPPAPKQAGEAAPAASAFDFEDRLLRAARPLRPSPPTFDRGEGR